jgi:hypothetical protein
MKQKTQSIFYLIVICSLCACSNSVRQSGISDAKSARSETPTHTRAIMPAVQLEKPAAIIETLNRLYNESNNTCSENGSGLARGHYYCSGITFQSRGFTSDTPWIYEPQDLARGSTNWQWLRHELSESTPIYEAGFILRNAADASKKNLPGLDAGFICIFPYYADSYNGREHQGCGPATKSGESTPKSKVSARNRTKHANNEYAWGYCDQLGIKTAAQWNAHWIAADQSLLAQCSWNVESQSGWNALLTSRQSFPNRNTIGTDLMLINQRDGSQMPQYITAVFYNARLNCGAGLAMAQAMQKKLNDAGFSVPILSADFTPGVLSIFSYLDTDQAVAQ